jgi:hypothetical protein
MSAVEQVELLSAREIAVREFNALRGRLCSVIETAGLPKSQERALVAMIKTTSYQNQAVVAELIDKLEEASDRKLCFRLSETRLEEHES